MNKFLQTSPILEDNFGGSWMNFKCLSCKKEFHEYPKLGWKFCPECGSKIEIIYQDIKEKQYKDNAGYNTFIDGKWVKVNPPIFNLRVSFKSCLGIEEYNSKKNHKNLIFSFLNTKRYNKNVSFEIIPSAVLPLP